MGTMSALLGKPVIVRDDDAAILAALSRLALTNRQAQHEVEFSRPNVHDVPMTWQEFQESVARLYEQMEGFGTVKRNVFLPDKDTGTRRQVDVLWQIEAKGHLLTVVIDAKFRKEPLDVKDIEEVASLAEAVKASKAVIVALKGWNQSAAEKAAALALDLRLMTLEEALKLRVESMWQMCEHCGEDCVVLDQEGVTVYQGGWLWWLAGQCRHCKTALVWCQHCGEKAEVGLGERFTCGCGHAWWAKPDGIYFHLASGEQNEAGN
jgi:hypothetical protein